jgi:hypothetical protein
MDEKMKGIKKSRKRWIEGRTKEKRKEVKKEKRNQGQMKER